MFTLAWVRSIKLKFSIVIVAAIATAVITSQVGYALGWPIWLRPIIATIVSLLAVQILARGMTRPLTEMVAGVERVAQIIGEISNASANQSQSVLEVGAAISQMDEVTQRNASLVEEVASAAGALREQAQDLVRMVWVFRLAETQQA